MFRLHLAVQRIVQWLAGHRPVDPGLIAHPADLRHPPASVIGNAKVANLARPDQVRENMNSLGKRCRVVFLM